MEDFLLVEEIFMLPEIGERRRYQPRRNLFQYDTDRQFVRFTKEVHQGGGAEAGSQVEPYLAHENNRGLPMSAIDQVSVTEKLHFINYIIDMGGGLISL